MALLRGLKSLFPCVLCDVPSDCLWDVTEQWGIRNHEDIKRIVLNEDLNKTQKKDFTKAFGVRPAPV